MNGDSISLRHVRPDRIETAVPKLLPLIDPEANVIVGYLEFKPGFLFFPEKETMQWEYLSSRGLVITPLDTNLVSAIIGLYFGGSLVKK